jgi:hypothetical protein
LHRAGIVSNPSNQGPKILKKENGKEFCNRFGKTIGTAVKRPVRWGSTALPCGAR